jgi:hypothetical protein
MTPIPATARLTDLRWEPAFLELAHRLVRLNAKSRLIQRVTGLSSRRITRLYREIGQGRSPAGPLIQGSAGLFALPSAETSAVWNVQCALFIACYEDIGEAAQIRLNHGWQLMTAYDAYAALRASSDAPREARQLDVNSAYVLLSHAGFLESPLAELQRTRCKACMLRYLIVRSVPLDAQACPMCRMSRNYARLARQGFGT